MRQYQAKTVKPVQDHPQISHLHGIYPTLWLIQVNQRLLLKTNSARACLSIMQSSAFLSPHRRQGGCRAPRETVGTSNGDKINIYALPNETITRNLIARYFGDTGLLFPYIHEQTFLNTYNEIKANGFTKIRRAWLGLLNMIMAMATSTTIVNGLSAEKRARESDVYYQRAMGLCKEQIMRGTSLEIGKFIFWDSTSVTNYSSSVSPSDRSIPAGHATIRGSMDCSRSCSQGCFPTRTPFHCCQ